MNNLLQLFKKSRLNRYWQRNLFYITFIMLVFVLGFWAGIANAATPKTHTTATVELYGPAKPITLDNVEQRLRSQYATSTTTTTRVIVRNITIPKTEVLAEHTGLMSQAGIDDKDFGYVEWLVSKESGWQPQIVNRSSGACGIPQSLPCSKLPQGINTPPVDQLVWMDNYVTSRYGSWAEAVTHSRLYGWY